MYQTMIKKRRLLKRHKVLHFICDYALEHNGATPNYAIIGREFGISDNGARIHVLWLANEGFLRMEDRNIIIEDSAWEPPPHYERLE